MVTSQDDVQLFPPPPKGNHHPHSWQELKEGLAHSISNHCHSPKHLRRLHARVFSSGLRRNLYLSTLLITRYFNLGDPRTARLVFDSQSRTPTKTILWNSLIRGYLRIQSPRQALHVYQEMVCEPDKQTFHLAITACTHLSEFEFGSRVGEHARRNGMESDRLVSTALVCLHLKAGDIKSARNVFDRMSFRDAVSWNAMISGYVRAGCISEAVNLFRSMRFLNGVLPTEATMVSVISGCGESSALQEGKVFHAHAIKIGFEDHQFVSNSMMTMYIDCHCLDVAEGLFARMDCKDAVSWSTMIGGYVRCGRAIDALRLFHLMVQNAAIVPSRPVLLNVLLACAHLGDWREGKWIEENYVNRGNCGIESDASLVTALIYMYAKSGEMEVSLKHLDEDVQVRADVIAWNAMIKACAELGRVDKVLELTLKMQRRGIDPDRSTFLMMLSVLSSTPLLRIVIETHAQIIKRGLESEITIANSFIDVYAKCGSIGDSCKVYNGIQEKDVISWSSIIKAYAWNGDAEEALDHFQLMRKTETRPNKFTFLAVISACSHAGHIAKGRELFEIMKEEYGLEPDIEHFTCMMDMFCRAGLLGEAYELLQDEMLKACSGAALWGTLLSACRLHGDSGIGESAAKQLFYLEPGNAANYLMLADIYTSAGRVDDADEVLRLLSVKGLEKRPSCSWFEEQ